MGWGGGWDGVGCWASRTFSAGKMLRSDEGGPGMGGVVLFPPSHSSFHGRSVWKLTLKCLGPSVLLLGRGLTGGGVLLPLPLKSSELLSWSVSFPTSVQPTE